MKTLPMLTEFVCVLLNGDSVFLFSKKPIGEVGKEIALKETFRYSGNKIECQADVLLKTGNINGEWWPSNNMKESDCIRKVVITDIELMNNDEIDRIYGDIIKYNNRYWSVAQVKDMANLWFRPNIVIPIPAGTYYKQELKIVN